MAAWTPSTLAARTPEPGMAKKKADPREEQRAAADYYKLNVRAVDDLVEADESNSPPVSEAELRKYRAGHRIKLSEAVKAVLIKAWFAGAVCFFFLWGLGISVHDQLDQMLVVGLALGLVTDLLTNNVLRFIEKTPRGNDRWMMCPQRRYISLPLNILYGFLLLLLVVTTYNVLNRVILALTGPRDSVPLGVGPILFAVFTTAWDLLLIWMKHTMKRIIADARRASGRG